MTLRSSDLQSDSYLDSTRNSCDVLYKNIISSLVGESVWTQVLRGKAVMFFWSEEMAEVLIDTEDSDTIVES